MGLSNNINAYNDVRVVLDAAVDAGGGRVNLPSPGKAVHWRQRAYKLRSLLTDRDGSTAWDEFQLTVEGASVVVRPRELPLVTDLAGNPLEPIDKPDEVDDDLLEIARGLNLEVKGG